MGPVFVVGIIGARTIQITNSGEFNLTPAAPHFKGNPLIRRWDMKTGVFVNAYERVRFGQVEHVCAHWRSR